MYSKANNSFFIEKCRDASGFRKLYKKIPIATNLKSIVEVPMNLMERFFINSSRERNIE